MSEQLPHECGIAMIRLLKPLDYYYKKYGTWQYAHNKLYLLMEKQHNRGQEAAGIGVVNLNAIPGEEYIFRERKLGLNAIKELFESVAKLHPENIEENPNKWLKSWGGASLLLGHLRYGTTGRTGIKYAHPFLRRNNWQVRNLMLAGNFNLTNTEELFQQLINTGQHPRHHGDTFLLLEQMGHYLDHEVQDKYEFFKKNGLTSTELSDSITKELDISAVLKKAAPSWDGGYVIAGLLGSGDAFVLRDPAAIRPCFYYHDDEIVVVASERPVIQTVMNIALENVHELPEGTAMIIKRNGELTINQILTPIKNKACSFERIYFSRGGDADIYQERKKLGEQLTENILKTIDYDIENTVFSFIPNTAEIAFYGLLDGLNDYLNKEKIKRIQSVALSTLSEQELNDILSLRIRAEKVAIKDVKLRTFIAQDKNRNDLATHVYDVTYGIIKAHKDKLVVIDDSIVRGTTLKQSIISILDRLNPLKIVIVSSSPQVRYPDCYGIAMSSMEEFIAFRAAIELLKETSQIDLIKNVYEQCKNELKRPKTKVENPVKNIYAAFTEEQIARKIAQMLTPKTTKAEIQLVFQSIEGLHKACPQHLGDWYFSGNYPTAGGMKFVCEAFIRYVDSTL
ncbi:MAG: amidophosphoribosyltransferase [Bacteroidales bacterium]